MPVPTILTLSDNPATTPPDVNRAYSPINHGFAHLQGQGITPPALEVEVFINGQKIGQSIFPDYTLGSFGNLVVYGWIIDSQGLARRFFDGTTMLPPVAAPGCFANEKWEGNLFLRGFLWTDVAGNGSLVRDPNFSQTATVKVINATANPRDVSDFTGYTDALGGTSENRYLTDKPDRVLIGLDETEYLGFLTQGITFVQVTTYNSDGSVRGQGLIPAVAAGVLTQRVGLVGVGPANLNATNFQAATGDLEINENVDYYLVRAGWGIVAGPGAGTFCGAMLPRRYIPQRLRFRTYRFHFMNTFGVPDSLSIYNVARETYDIESIAYTRPLPQAVTTETEGRRRLRSTAERRIRGIAQNLTPKEAEFYAKFLRSTTVYLEEEGEYIPVLLEDTGFEVVNNERGLVQVEFEATYTVIEQSQSR